MFSSRFSPVLFCLVPLFLAPGKALSQDSRDADIFGEAAPTPKAEEKKQTSPSEALADTLQIGGRLEFRLSTSPNEKQSFGAASQTITKQADIYFDSRPNADLRAFLRTRFSESPSTSVLQGAGGVSNTNSPLKVELDELWFKWDLEDSVFFTAGKQHIKWGSGRFWNPTDFLAAEVRDPFALFDRRLGRELLKIHIPMEKQNFNHYVIAQFDGVQRNNEVGLGLRSELAIAGNGEIAFSFQTRRKQALRFGADLSTALGPVDVYIEAALSRNVQRTFYEGGFDAGTATFPTGEKKEKKLFTQVTGGIQKSLNYSDEDSATLGAEYFYNGMGYKNRVLELYSLVMGQSSVLMSGEQYAGAYVRIPQPGPWNKTTILANGIQNLSDKTALARLTLTWEMFRHATFEVFGSRCFGDYGELCFRAPSEIVAFSEIPQIPAEQRAILSALPTERNLFSAGLGLSMSF
jgi:hypothetical protein